MIKDNIKKRWYKGKLVKLDRRTGYCTCEETKDEFGGCVPNEKGNRCIACGFRIKKVEKDE
jgi:hypothetical protein